MKNLHEILHESIKKVLLENRESKNINLARKFLKSKGYNDENAQKILDAIRTGIPNSRLAQCKFLLGVSRLYVGRELNDGENIQKLNKLLPYIASDAHVNEYDSNLNDLSLEDINRRFASAVQQDSELSRKNSYSKRHVRNSEYDIVRIPDFEEASKYGKYTSWCVTHDKNMYNSYTKNGIGLFYFCLKNGFENVRKIKGENAPLDEYGLSMIAVSVDEDGEVNTITSRWNHDMEGNDHIMSKDELEDLLGINFYEVFKPYSDEELMKKGYISVSKVRELLSNGKELSEIFKTVRKVSADLLLCSNGNGKSIFYNVKYGKIPDCIKKWFNIVRTFSYNLFIVNSDSKWSLANVEGELIGDGKLWFDYINKFSDGFAKVKLNGSYSLIDKSCKLIGDGKLWFDGIYEFLNGFCIVILNKKYSFINSEGKLIKDGKLWLDWADNFYEGFAVVELNDKYTLIDENGDFIGDGNAWFYSVSEFTNGFSVVEDNDKCSFIDKNGKLIGGGDEWFDNVYDFHNGFAGVELNHKWSFIDGNGKLIGNGKIWFDSISNFHDGFADVNLNDEWFIIDKSVNFYDITTKQPIKSPFSNESIDKVGKILRECINDYLK